MEQLKTAIRKFIDATEIELLGFTSRCEKQKFRKKELIYEPHSRPNFTFFITRGMVRYFITDMDGTEHTIHFSIENEFAGDYASMLENRISYTSIQALEPLEIIKIPKTTIEWGYRNMRYGDRLGRRIAESYFTLMDRRIQDVYLRSTKQRYQYISESFPNIHNRVPQHMIASYLGITAVHLSRLRGQ